MAAKEFLDKVTATDQIVGTTHKEEAHRKGYIHRVVVVYVFTSQGELIVQRVGKTRLYDHSVGGHVIKGESYDLAVKRESHEELGIKGPFSYIGRLYSNESASYPYHKHIYSIYRSQVNKDWKFTTTTEVKDIEIMTLPYIVNTMKTEPHLFTTGFINTMDYYLRASKHLLSPEA